MIRGNGILLGISSLPGDYGIGTIGKPARTFIDRLSDSGQKYWQILPVSPTGFGDSPYQSLSVFAGNPYYIDFDDLFSEGLLTEEELDACGSCFETNSGRADYYAQYLYKEKLLYRAYTHVDYHYMAEMKAFQNRNASWLDDYALYMAIKKQQGMAPFWKWPKELAGHREHALEETKNKLQDEINYYIFVQYVFFRQWTALKAYANEKGIRIIGDMPIYMANDSADAWAHADILDNKGDIAGCPPDYFSPTGQLWGNPVYDWDQLKQQGYCWWIDRVKNALELYDYIRLDHFRGFEAFYSIPAGSETAENGHWKKGPGVHFFETLKDAFQELPFIAEDLGFLTPEVFELLEKTGFPGLKVLHFAFDPNAQSIYLPHNFVKNCIVYTGTHDNDTTRGWYHDLCDEEKAFLYEYIDGIDEKSAHWKMIRMAMASVADVCILPMQDLLGLGSQARMNIPQTKENNWRWRMKEDEFDIKLAEKLRRLTFIYGR